MSLENDKFVDPQKLFPVSAIQELQSQLTLARRDRDSAQSVTSNRERELQELKREVNNVIEKKRKLEQELSRLKEHLVAVEESGTQEVLAYEERERELRRKLQVTFKSFFASTSAGVNPDWSKAVT